VTRGDPSASSYRDVDTRERLCRTRSFDPPRTLSRSRRPGKQTGFEQQASNEDLTIARGGFQNREEGHSRSPTNKNQNIIDMKKLKHGLHVAIVTSPCAGHGGSLFAWETYMACTLRGVPSILASFDYHRLYPDIGKDLRRLSIGDGHAGRHIGSEALACLLPIAEEARTENKLLIIDTKAGFLPDDQMFKVLAQARIPDATSVAALMPVRHGLRPYFADFESHGIRITRGLFRYWGFRSDKPEIASTHTPPLYHWTPAFLTPEVRELILPTRRKPMPKGVEDEIGDLVYFPESDDPHDQYIRHVGDAVTTLWKTLLEPITESVRFHNSNDL